MEQYIDLVIEIPNEPDNFIRVRSESLERAMTALEEFYGCSRTKGKELTESLRFAQVYYIGRAEVKVSKPFFLIKNLHYKYLIIQ